MGVLVVVDYADTRFSNFPSNISAITKNFAKPFLTVHMGPRSNLLSQKMVENLTRLSL